MNGPSRTWFRVYRPQPQAKTRLVCFPHAGGTASFYRSWPDRLAAQVQLLALKYPGREARLHEDCIDVMDRLADRIAEALATVLDRPLALFGHSMGATVAYEVARRLESRSATVALAGLFVSGQTAPHLHRDESKHLWDDDALWEEMKRLGGSSDPLLENPELRAIVLPFLRNDYRLIETYRHVPGPALRCPVTAFVGDSDPEVEIDEARGWEQVTRGQFELRVFPGHHFYLVPEEASVIEEIVRQLALATVAARAD